MTVSSAAKVSLGLALLPSLAALSPSELHWPHLRQESAQPDGDESAEPLRETFDELVDEIHKKAKRGKWKAGRAQLVELLEAYEDAPWILTRVGEVRERMGSYAFWTDFDPPTAKDAVPGDVKKYSASTGKIEVHYDWDKGESVKKKPYDFFAAGDEPDPVWIHPAVFTGPYSIEVRGIGCGGRAQLYGGLVSGDHFHVVAFNNSKLSSLQLCRGEQFTELSADTTNFSGDRRYTFQFEVQKKRVRAAVNGKTVLQADRDKDDPWGLCGFVVPRSLEKVVIRGQVDPGWVDGLIDEEVQTSLLAFEESYERNGDVPASLVKRMGAPEPMVPDLEEVYPGDKTDELDDLLHEFVKRADRDGAAGARRWLKRLEDSEPEPFRRWITLLAAAMGDDTDRVKEECDQIIRLAPSFYWAHAIRAGLRVQELSHGEALAEARELVERFPKLAAPYKRYVNLMLVDGDLSAAKAVFDQAVLAGAPAEAMEPLRKTLTGAEHGPRWDRVEEWKGKQYIVRSNMAVSAAAEAGRELENSYMRWNRHLRRIPKSKRGERAVVYLFGGEAGYHAYTKDILEGPAENTAGVFISSIQQLLIWNMPDREEWKRTIRHEGFHQFLDRLAPTAPIWFHEGMAQYYETSRSQRGRWIEGAVRMDLVATLREDPMIPLKNFVALDSSGFMRNAGRNYAQAWAFVHFLQHHKNRKYKKAFNAFVDALVEGAGAKVALEGALKLATFDALDQELAAYVRGLR